MYLYKRGSDRFGILRKRASVRFQPSEVRQNDGKAETTADHQAGHGLLRMALCNRVRDYSPLERLKKLQVLTIEANRLPSILFLEQMASLQKVALPVGRLDDKQLPNLSRLTSLREFGVPTKRWSAPLVEKIESQLPDCEVQVWG